MMDRLDGGAPPTESEVFATITRARLVPATRAAALDVLRRMVELDHTEPGTLVQAFHVDADDENVVHVYELWASPAALDEHRRNGSHLRDELAPLFDGPFELVRCRPMFGKGLPVQAGP